MKKTALLMATMLIVLAFIAGSVWAETFEYSAPVKYSQQKLADGSFLIVLDGPLSLSDGVLYVYHQDNMRGRSVRKQRIEPRVFTDNHKEWVIDPFTIKIGQVMFNLFSPQMVRWSGIPNCLVSLGDGLVFGDSYPDGRVKHDGTWDEPGGTGIVLVASGIPVQYPVDNSGCYEAPKRVVIVPALAPVKIPVKAVRRRVVRKVPCPDGKGICSQPCIIEIKEGVEKLVESVGMPTKDEPADEKTLQQKARKTLDSLGVADKTDEADEKTLQQKARKGLKLKKEIHKAVGTSKSGRSLHDKLGESKRPNGQLIPIAEEMHQDLKDIKAHLNIPKEKLNDCTKCHNDSVQKAK